jgi:arylsulfatase A-like enzyme
MKLELLTAALAGSLISFGQSKQPPNVILIITDDQGYGDFGFTGNPHVKTPILDKFAGESVRLTNFYVCPVSAPTRASLMTGRNSLRTGIHDTYNGGAIMATEEYTIAEMLKDAGYNTGIFGKWHLGDNYPSRSQDQGFNESIIHLSGGMGQVGDFTTFFKGDSSYYNPVLWHNGKQEKFAGYCSDIFTDQAIKYIETNRNKNFFCYLSFNAPHTPLQVPEKYYDLYRNTDPSSGFQNGKIPFPVMSESDKEDARKVYAMVTNIDENIGKLLKKLEDLKIDKNTLVIFMTDNGPQQRRYNGGMRGLKGSVYRGGVRVPFFMRCPTLFKGDKDIDINTAHIDILPTLAEICNARIPENNIIDGKNLMPLLRGESVDWSERPLFFYWTRKYPELYNNIALLQGNYKLVGHTGYDSEIIDFELFDIEQDPFELTNIVFSDRKVASDLKNSLDKVFYELVESPYLVNQPRIIIGNENENPVILNRNDADGEREIWTQEEIFGKWNVTITAGIYNIKFKFIKPLSGEGSMVLQTNTFIIQNHYKTEKTDEIEMKNVNLPSMKCEFIPFYSAGPKRIFPFWVEIEKVKKEGIL